MSFHFILLANLWSLWGLERRYVTRNGSDVHNCGYNTTSSCGTLYFASTDCCRLHYIYSPKIEIYVDDGQNELEIIRHINDSQDYNPCLFKAKNPAISLRDCFPGLTDGCTGGQLMKQITFNDNKIKTFRDWYPFVCDRYNITFANSYLFEYVSGKGFSINNLIVENYTIPNSMSLFYGVQEIHNATFNTIMSSNTDALIYFYTDALIVNSIFNNIIATKTFMESHEISIISSEFVNISVDTFLPSNEYHTITIVNCIFNYIDTKYPLITGSTEINKYVNVASKSEYLFISITNSVFNELNSYGIIYTENDEGFTVINGSNITLQVSTNANVKKYGSTSNVYAIFKFGLNTNVTFDNMTITYLYDLTTDNFNAGGGGGWYNVFEIPVPLIQSHGNVMMNNVIISAPNLNQALFDKIVYGNKWENAYYACAVNKHMWTSSTSNCYINGGLKYADYYDPTYSCGICDLQYVFDRNSMPGLFMNSGHMMISNVHLLGIPFSSSMFVNVGELYINNFDYDIYPTFCTTPALCEMSVNRNVLRLLPFSWLYQAVSNNALTVLNNVNASNVRSFILYIETGSLRAFNSIFHTAPTAIYQKTESLIQIENCEFHGLQYQIKDATDKIHYNSYYLCQQTVYDMSWGTPPDNWLHYDYNTEQNWDFRWSDWTNASKITCLQNTGFDVQIYTSSLILRNANILNSKFSQNNSFNIINATNLELINCTFESKVGEYDRNYNTFSRNALQISYATILGNSFIYYGNQRHDAWILMKRIDSDQNTVNMTSCMYGNIFYGFSIELLKGDITSCSRTNLIGSINNGSINTPLHFNDIKINKSLLQQRSVIVQQYVDQIIFAIYDEDSSIIFHDTIFILPQQSNIESIYNIDVGIAAFYDITIDNNAQINFEQQHNDNCESYIIMNSPINNSIYIYRATLQCDVNATYSSPFTVLQSNHSSLPYLLSVYLSDNRYYPGGLLYVDIYEITDINGNIIPFNQFYGYPIQIFLSCEMCGDNGVDINYNIQLYNDSCPTCVSGIFIPSVSFNNVGESYFIKTTFYNDYFWITEGFNITFVNCPQGYGAGYSSLQCEQCGQYQFNLHNDTNQSCFSCETDIDINCNGDQLNIPINHWVAVRNISTNHLITNELFGDNDIVFAACPIGYCCGYNKGCDFLTGMNAFDNKSYATFDYLCSANRNFKYPLCGKCIDGYSEAFFTSQCMQCKQNSFIWLLYPISISIIFSIYLLISKSTSIDSSEYDLNATKSFIQKILHQRKQPICILIKVCILKVIIYFEQLLSLLLSINGYSLYLSIFPSLFNFTLNNHGNNNFGVCFIKNMSAKQEILFELILIAFIMFNLAILSIISFCISSSKKYNYGQSFISMLLLCIGKILSVLFSLLSCKTIENTDEKNKLIVQFYFGSEKCFGPTWWYTFVFLLLIILMLIILLVITKRNYLNNRDNKLWFLYPIVSNYKSEYFYWEFVILLRRILFTFFVINFDTNYISIILCIILGIFLFLHHKIEPFVIQQVNDIEFACIFGLIIGVIVQKLISNEVLGHIFYTILFVFPFVLLTYYGCKCIKIYRQKTVQYDDPYLQMSERLLD
eukprot:281352_1